MVQPSIIRQAPPSRALSTNTSSKKVYAQNTQKNKYVHESLCVCAQISGQGSLDPLIMESCRCMPQTKCTTLFLCAISFFMSWFCNDAFMIRKMKKQRYTIFILQQHDRTDVYMFETYLLQNGWTDLMIYFVSSVLVRGRF